MQRCPRTTPPHTHRLQWTTVLCSKKTCNGINLVDAMLSEKSQTQRSVWSHWQECLEWSCFYRKKVKGGLEARRNRHSCLMGTELLSEKMNECPRVDPGKHSTLWMYLASLDCTSKNDFSGKLSASSSKRCVLYGFVFIYRKNLGAAEMAQQLKTLATLPQDLGPVASTHNSLKLQLQGIWNPLLVSMGTAHIWCTT